MMQLSEKNQDMKILIDLKTQKTIKLINLIQDWWGWDRYNYSDAK